MGPEPETAGTVSRVPSNVPDELLLDEMFSPAIATDLAARFESLRRAHEAAGGKVPGLIYTSDLTFPRTKEYVSRLWAALAATAARRETARCGGVLWLRPPA